MYGAFLRRRAIGASAAIVVALLAGLAAVAIASASESGPTNWTRNASGQTYGSGLLARSPADEPDLILVEATNGKVGYSSRVDLEGPEPKTPEEALRLQAAQGGKPRAIPVYLSDGKTAIGVFLCEYGPGMSMQ